MLKILRPLTVRTILLFFGSVVLVDIIRQLGERTLSQGVLLDVITMTVFACQAFAGLYLIVESTAVKENMSKLSQVFVVMIYLMIPVLTMLMVMTTSWPWLEACVYYMQIGYRYAALAGVALASLRILIHIADHLLER